MMWIRLLAVGLTGAALILGAAWALDVGLLSEQEMLWLVLPVVAIAIGLVVGGLLKSWLGSGRGPGSN